VTRQRLLRAAWTVAASCAVIVAVVGVLHTPLGRPLLARLGMRAGCPVMNAHLTPQQIETGRVQAGLPLRGTARAPQRPALEFALMKATAADVRAWAAASGLACSEELAGTALRCAAPVARAARDLYFRFDPAGVLVALDVMHEGVSPEEAAREFERLRAELAREVGAPTVSRDTLDAEPLSQRAVQYRFRDYAADVSATNFGAQGVVIREQYRALPD
jgi:hypothetical protein